MIRQFVADNRRTNVVFEGSMEMWGWSAVNPIPIRVSLDTMYHHSNTHRGDNICIIAHP